MEEFLSKKKPGIVGFENPRPLQATTDAKIKRWLLGRG